MRIRTPYFGKVCAKHPELKGERYQANYNCVGCLREKMRRLYDAAPERKRAQARKWSKDNLPRKREHGKRWRTANPAVVRAMQRRWRSENPEKARDKQVRWKKANPGKAQKYCVDRRARVRGAAVPLTAEEQALVTAKYAEAARLTAETGIPHHVDHDKPLARGGVHHPSNLVVIPANVNLAKGARYDSTLDFILS